MSSVTGVRENCCTEVSSLSIAHPPQASTQTFAPLRGWHQALGELLSRALSLKGVDEALRQRTLLQFDGAVLEMTAQHSDLVAWTLSDDGAWIVVYKKGKINDNRFPHFFVPTHLVPGLINSNGFSEKAKAGLWAKYRSAVALQKTDSSLRPHRHSTHRSRHHRPRFKQRLSSSSS